MKSIQLKAIFIITIAASMFSGCTKDSDAEYPVPATVLLSEKFDSEAVVNASQLYKATGTLYTGNSSSLTNISSVVASAITFTPALATDKVFVSASATIINTATPPAGVTTSVIKGILTYTDGTGTVVSIPGVVSKQNGTGASTGAETNGVNFVPTTNSNYTNYTGEAYLLVLPNRESAFTVGTTVTLNTTPLAENVFNNILLTNSGWMAYSETGAKKWYKGTHSGDSYAIFTSFTSGEANNVSWLISPEINMDTQEGEKLTFQSCTDGFVRSLDNSLELMVATDYDGTNFTSASWAKVDFNVPNPNNTKFVYVNSGIIDLSSYKGKLHFAFKMKGTSSQTGGYQIDNVNLFY